MRTGEGIVGARREGGGPGPGLLLEQRGSSGQVLITGSPSASPTAAAG